jgi:hypothetical protein
MTDDNFRQDGMNQQDLENDMLDRELDAALAKFAAAEPRTGLEERILANLRAEPELPAERSWWRWPVLAALAVIVVAVSVTWRSGKPVQNIAAHPPATRQTSEISGNQVASRSGSGSIRPHEAGPGRQPNTRAVSHTATVVVPTPKLEQFPSPQPLSEQERILADYVADYPDHAALIAQARAEALLKDSAEEMREAVSAMDENSQRSNQ